MHEQKVVWQYDRRMGATAKFRNLGLGLMGLLRYSMGCMEGGGVIRRL